MTRLAESYTIRDIVSEFGIRGKWLNVVRVQLNSFAFAFVVMSAAILTGVIISPVNSLTPFFVFNFAACYVVLMGLINMSLEMLLSICYSHFPSWKMVFEITGQGAILSLSSLLLVFRHWIAALWAKYSYLHAHITDAFSIGFLIALKSITASKACFTNAAGWSRPSGSARATVSSGRFVELRYMRTWVAAIFAWRKTRLIAYLAQAVVASVVTAYSASILHCIQYTTSRLITQLERMSTAFPGIEIKRI